MAFSGITKYRASLRQSKWDGWGSWCAKCGTALAGKKAEVTQRVVGKDWDFDNCVVLCPDCFEKIGSHKNKLTDTQIPYYQRYPDLWHGDTPYVIKTGQTSAGVKV
jgi:hypothetical protein